MKNKVTDHEISAFIKQTLDGYQEDYIPGTWENFVRRKRGQRRRIVWLISSGIAASLLAGFLLFNFHNPVIENENDRLKNNHPIVATKNQGSPSTTKDTPTKPEAGLIPEKRAGILVAVATPVETKVISGKRATDLLVAPDQPRNSPNDSVKIPPASQKTTEPTARKTAIRPVDHLPVEDRRLAEVTAKRRVRIGVNFSPGINATQTASSFNFAGGISADFAVYSNFQLSAGLQFENQSIVSNGAQVSTSGPASQSKANLMNLDLPLNITWRFFPGRLKSYYISAGVSSLAYLKESYQNTTYSQQLVAVTSMAGGHQIISYNIVDVPLTTQNTISPFRTFDLAGRLNFLVGYEQQLSPRLFLHLEPYVKIPVSGLATQNLKYISSGVNFKISF